MRLTSNPRPSDNRQRRRPFAVLHLEALEDRLQPSSVPLGLPWDFLASNLMQPDAAFGLTASDTAHANPLFLTAGDEHTRLSGATVDAAAGSGQRADRGAVAPAAVPSASAKDSAPSVSSEWLAASSSQLVIHQQTQARHLTEVQATITLRNNQTQLAPVSGPVQVQQRPGGNAAQNWATHVTATPTTATGQGVTQDGSGNVYVTGSTDEGTTKAAFVAEYDPTGVPIFFKKFQAKDVSTGLTDNHSEGHAIALDGAGNIYVAGKATNPTSRLQDAFIMRFDGTGAADPTYGVGFDTGGLGNVTANGLAVGSDGTATIVGTARFLGNDIFMAVIGPDGSVAANATHAFAPGSFVDSQGQQVFTATVANAVAVSADGSVAYISGTGTHPGGDPDVMMMLVDTNSGGQSVAGFSYVPNKGIDSGNGVVIGPTGSVFQASTATVTTNGQAATFATVISWTADISTASYGVYDTNTTTGTGIAVDPAGNVYLTGTATDLLGNTRALADLLDSTGAVADTLLIAENGSGQESGTGIVYSQDGTVYLTGSTSSSNLSTDGSGLNGDQDAFLANVGSFMF